MTFDWLSVATNQIKFRVTVTQSKLNQLYFDLHKNKIRYPYSNFINAEIFYLSLNNTAS